MSVETKQIPTAEAEIKQQLAESLDLPKNEKKSDSTLEFQLKLVRGEIIDLAEEAAKPEEFANTEQAEKTQEVLKEMSLSELTMTLKLMQENPETLSNLVIIKNGNKFEKGKVVEMINKANEITPTQLAEIQKVNDEARAKLELNKASLETNYRMKGKEKAEGIEATEEINPEFNRNKIFAKSPKEKDKTERKLNDIEKTAEVDSITATETQKFLFEAGKINKVSFADQMNEQIKLSPNDVAERIINGEKVGSPFFTELSIALEKMMMTPNTPDEKTLQALWLKNSSEASQNGGKLQNFREVVDSIRKTESVDGSQSKEIIELYGKVTQNLIYNFNGWKKPAEKVEPANNIVNLDRKKSLTPTTATSQR
jgi:hypothetical protein